MIEILTVVMNYFERPGGSSGSSQFSVDISQLSVVFGTWQPMENEMKHIVTLLHTDPVITETCQWLKNNGVKFYPPDELSSSVHYLQLMGHNNKIKVNVESKTASVIISADSFRVKEFRSSSTNIDLLTLSTFGRLCFSADSDLLSSGLSVDVSVGLVVSPSSYAAPTVLKFTLLKGELTAFNDTPILFILPDLFSPHSLFKRKELFYLCALRALEKSNGAEDPLTFQNTDISEKIILSMKSMKTLDSRSPVSSIKILVDFSLIKVLLLGRDGSSCNLQAKSAVLSLLLLSNAETLTVKISLHDMCLKFVDALTGKSWTVSKCDLLSLLFTSVKQEKLILDIGFEKCQLYMSLEVMLMVEVRWFQ
jgi:hypothetical protein